MNSKRKVYLALTIHLSFTIAYSPFTLSPALSYISR